MNVETFHMLRLYKGFGQRIFKFSQCLLNNPLPFVVEGVSVNMKHSENQ